MKNILIADDDEMITTMLSHKFKRDGFNIVLANNGFEAKTTIEKTIPDILVTDLMMPYLSGLELIEFMRKELNSEIPIIVLSVTGQENTVLRAFDMGANDFVSKPFSPKELSMRIKNQLE